MNCLQLMGFMVAALEAIPYAKFHLQQLQYNKYNFLQCWNKDHHDLQQEIPILLQTRGSLYWWTTRTNLTSSRSWAPPTWEVVMTDTSTFGWGQCTGHTRYKANGHSKNPNWPFGVGPFFFRTNQSGSNQPMLQ